jgi:chromosome partitioning protein
MRVMTVFNVKGGAGKSTIACNLAVEAVREGQKVLLIDSDTQASSMDFRAARAENEALPQFQAVAITKSTLHKDIKAFGDFDLILIDAGGRDTGTHRSAVIACDVLLIPVLPSQYDIWASQGTIEVMEEAATIRHIKARILLNQVIPNTRVAEEAIEALKAFTVPLCVTRIHSRVAFKQSIVEG